MEYTKKDRKKGGLGPMNMPLLADITHDIARDYGCLVDVGGETGVAFRATYIIDANGIRPILQRIPEFKISRNLKPFNS